MALAALITGAAFAVSAEPVTPVNPPTDRPWLAAEWNIQNLDAPESVALSEDGRHLYISNVNGEGDAVDGNGYIARVGRDGQLGGPSTWVSGLDAPKGMAVRDGKLYVADITRVVVIDTTSGRILSRHDAPGAGFMNDVAIAPDRTVLIADSARQRIYAFDGATVTPWLEDPLLRSVNGLLPEPGRLVVTTMQGRLLAVDWGTKQVTTLAEGLGNGDGVARLQDGTYLVSEWPGRLFLVRADGSHVVVADTREQERYWNDFLLLDDLLLVPHWKPGELTAYRIRTGAG